MSEVIIDATNKLNAKYLFEFLEGLSPETAMFIQVTKTSGITFETSSTIANITTIIDIPKQTFLEKADDVYICAGEKILKTSGYDILWYNTDKRIEKLFTAPKTKKTSAASSTETITVLAATMEYDEVSHVESFTGSKKEAIQFINKMNSLYTIKYFSSIPVFNLNDSGYKTLDKLIEEGIVS